MLPHTHMIPPPSTIEIYSKNANTQIHHPHRLTTSTTNSPHLGKPYRRIGTPKAKSIQHSNTRRPQPMRSYFHTSRGSQIKSARHSGNKIHTIFNTDWKIKSMFRTPKQKITNKTTDVYEIPCATAIGFMSDSPTGGFKNTPKNTSGQ